MAAILAAPIGVVADTECGSGFTSLFRISDDICGPSVQTRVLWAGLFGVAGVAMMFGAWRSAQR
jgi:hypothetical protein